MQQLTKQIAEAVELISERWPHSPYAGIILGTGLGNLAQHITQPTTIDYAEIPHFPCSTALSHKGQLVCGQLAGVNVVTMEGRFHLYEGYSPQQITLPVRMMQVLGAQLLIVSNASGGLNPGFASGDVMVIDDHVNLMWDNPLINIHDDPLEPQFPDMSRPYDVELTDHALRIARRVGCAAHRGVYVGLTGPSYETRAEYRFLRRIGDVVGMSTVPEVIVANQVGMRVLALSTVTNTCSPDRISPTSAHEVVAIASTVEPHLRAIVESVLEEC